MLRLQENRQGCPNHLCVREGQVGIPKIGQPGFLTCQECGEVWHPVKDTGRGVKVKVMQGNPCWVGQVGTVLEILPTNGCNVRVGFVINGYRYGDLFHPGQLDQLGGSDHSI